MSQFGIQGAITGAQLPLPATGPALARVELPALPQGPAQPVRRSAERLEPPRAQGMGSSPLASAALSDSYGAAVDAVQPRQPRQGGSNAGSHHGMQQGELGTALLPQSADLVAYARNPRGELVYLERERWNGHIVPAHVTQPPQARGKRTTTWWPVIHTATGASSMSEPQVVQTIMEAVRLGNWQNAPRGTRLAVYHLPERQAREFGVSEVKVSTAPDGRILSAYPTAGSNVLAVREVDGAAAQPATGHHQTAAAPRIAPTTFSR